MKRVLSILVSATLLTPSVAFSQQTNTYQVCRQYQENYVPGYYNSDGSYRQGGTYTIELTVNCQTGQVYSSRPYNGGGNYIAQPQPVYQYRTRNCNSAAGALLGAGLASALSGGTGWNRSGSWSNYYGRNSSSGSWNNSYRNNNGWTSFGAGLGALAFSC